jgi:hypothetical protein
MSRTDQTDEKKPLNQGHIILARREPYLGLKPV